MSDTPDSHLGAIRVTVEWGGLYQSIYIAELEDGPALQVRMATERAHRVMVELGDKLGLSQQLSETTSEVEPVENATGPDQVDALDEILDYLTEDVAIDRANVIVPVAKAKLSALLVEAREQGASASTESLTASGKQAVTLSLTQNQATHLWGILAGYVYDTGLDLKRRGVVKKDGTMKNSRKYYSENEQELLDNIALAEVIYKHLEEVTDLESLDHIDTQSTANPPSGLEKQREATK